MYSLLLIYHDSNAERELNELLNGAPMTLRSCQFEDLRREDVLTGSHDLIILDVFGTDKSWVKTFEGLETWIETSGAERPPVIVITTDASALTERSARGAGADFFFIKPVESMMLVAAIEQSVKMV